MRSHARASPVSPTSFEDRTRQIQAALMVRCTVCEHLREPSLRRVQRSGITWRLSCPCSQTITGQNGLFLNMLDVASRRQLVFPVADSCSLASSVSPFFRHHSSSSRLSLEVHCTWNTSVSFATLAVLPNRSCALPKAIIPFLSPKTRFTSSFRRPEAWPGG